MREFMPIRKIRCAKSSKLTIRENMMRAKISCPTVFKKYELKTIIIISGYKGRVAIFFITQ